MPKTALNKPLNAILVHYSDFTHLEPSVYSYTERYCKQLVSEGKTGQLWIYNNQDINFEYMPDVVIKNIKHPLVASSMGISYGKTNKVVWGTIAKYIPV